MSPEWMMAMQRIRGCRSAPRRGNRLDDPLDGAEWQGLVALSLWLARLLRTFELFESRGRHAHGSPGEAAPEISVAAG